MLSAPSISPEQMAVYRASARQRLTKERPQALRRGEQAWAIARLVSAMLKEHFGASRVVVFGSLAHGDCFTPWSDIDMAVWGLRPEDTLRALGAAMDMGTPIPVDLVDISTCRPALRAVIELEGVVV